MPTFRAMTPWRPPAVTVSISASESVTGPFVCSVAQAVAVNVRVSAVPAKVPFRAGLPVALPWELARQFGRSNWGGAVSFATFVRDCSRTAAEGIFTLMGARFSNSYE